MRLSSAIIFYACFQTSVIAIADNLPPPPAAAAPQRRAASWPQISNVVTSCAEQTWPGLSSDCLLLSADNLSTKVRVVGM